MRRKYQSVESLAIQKQKVGSFDDPTFGIEQKKGSTSLLFFQRMDRTKKGSFASFGLDK